MKNKINNILELWNEIKILRNDKIEKENIILSCANLIEKSLDIDKNNIKNKQLGISINLIELNDDLTLKMDKLVEIFKGISFDSLNNKKISFDLLSACMYNRVHKDKLKEIKEIIKSISEETYLDIPMNQKLNRVGLTYLKYLQNGKSC